MTRSAFISALVLVICVTARAEPPKPDVRTFEVTPAAPSTPALKYQLLFDDLGERRPGNAALLYFDSILLLGSDARDKTEKALDAYAAKDMRTFESLAGGLEMPNVFQELELAGRREHCDWEPPFREMGAYTLLPHLEPLAHAMTRLIKIKALRQIQQGKPVDALATLRLGYELGENVGQESVLVSGLVSLRITSQMNDVLGQLISQPDAPNLYWALRELPSRQVVLRKAFDGERQWFVAGYLSPWFAQPAAQGNQEHHPIVSFAPGETSRMLPQVSLGRTAASCTLAGRPCNPKYSICCRGLRCVFRGGSTRVGYQCFRAGSANASTSSFWERLSVNKLDHDDLAEVLW